jgi:hypothetical protein
MLLRSCITSREIDFVQGEDGERKLASSSTGEANRRTLTLTALASDLAVM